MAILYLAELIVLALKSSPSISNKTITTPIDIQTSSTNNFTATSPTSPISPNLSSSTSPTRPIISNLKSPTLNTVSPSLDPYQTSKLPGAKPPVPKKPDLLLSTKSTLTPNTKIEHPEWMSFSEKKRHFERCTSPNSASGNTGSQPTFNHSQKETITRNERFEELPNSGEMTTKETIKKVETYSKSTQEFSFSSIEELERFKEKLSDPIFKEKYLAGEIDDELDEDEDHFEDESNINGNRPNNDNLNDAYRNTFGDDSANKLIHPVFRTAKAEKRYKEKMLSMGIDIESSEFANLTPAQRKALEAEKRREWRQARLQSIEDDARNTLIQMQKNRNSNSKENMVEP